MREMLIGKHLAQHLAGLKDGDVGSCVFLKGASDLKRLGKVVPKDCG